MSNGWQLEFGIWGDNSLRLVFWDSQGNVGDRIYRLNPDGTADRTEILDDDSEVAIQVNLADDLRGLLDKLNHDGL
jgi:hypothetical protein